MSAHALPLAPITGDSRVSDVLFAVTGTAPVFARYRIDTCCGGARTLHDAADRAGIPLETLLTELSRTSDCTTA